MRQNSLQSIEVTPAEASLLALIREIGFGEIVQPVVGGVKTTGKREVTDKEHALVDAIREFPNPEVIMVHEYAPAYVVVHGEKGGYKYRRKIKL